MNRTSTAKAEANRKNAQRSTGPRNTDSTRYNATKHGLLAEGITELDDANAFRVMLAQLESEHCPVGIVEHELVRQIAMALIRSKRVRMLEAEEITAQLNPPFTKPARGDLAAGLLAAEAPEVIDAGLPARLQPSVVANLNSTLLRYETANENRLFRSLHQLERLQRMRKGEKIAAPVAVDVTLHSEAAPVASFGNTVSAPSDQT